MGNTGHHSNRPGTVVGRNPGASKPTDRGSGVRPSQPTSGRVSQPIYRSGSSSGSSGSSSYRSGSSGSSSNYRSGGSSSSHSGSGSSSRSSSYGGGSSSGGGNSRGR